MQGTYTYTARSADIPEQVVTFTIADHTLMVDTGAPVEQMERTLQATQAEVEGRHRVQPWLKPKTVSAIERITHPFSVGDVYARAVDGGLAVTAWMRAGGLRLAPVTFNLERVDNPIAAQAFVAELGQRKAGLGRPGRFPGPLDYWAGWLAAGLSVAAFLAACRYRRSRAVRAQPSQAPHEAAEPATS